MAASGNGGRPARKKAQRRHVLVVDGEPAICNLIQSVLADIGVQTFCAADAAEARRLLRRRRFALAFIAVVLRDEPGERLADDIAARGTSVVLMSGHPAGAERAEATRHPFLQKPFRVADLLRLAVTATEAT